MGSKKQRERERRAIRKLNRALGWEPAWYVQVWRRFLYRLRSKE